MATNKGLRRAIAIKLKQVRLARKQTQQQVADKLGLSRQMINRYEKGKDAPTEDNLLKVLRYVGDSIDVPAFGFTLTAQALEKPGRALYSVPRQLVLEPGKSHELPNATVQIVRRERSIEILISEASVASGRR
jgi:transcriptional regulator with XRE-family HTH domain